MPRRIMSRIHSNLVAYIALFVALGGTSAAAVDLANHSINPVKLNPRSIGGYVREWASVNANGHVTASGGRVTVRVQPGGVLPGQYYFAWHTRLTSPCTVIGSVDTGNHGSPGYLTTDLVARRGTTPTSIVNTYDPQGQPSNESFDVELVCATPR